LSIGREASCPGRVALRTFCRVTKQCTEFQKVVASACLSLSPFLSYLAFGLKRAASTLTSMGYEVRHAKSVRLLLVEDTPSDVRLMREGFRETRFQLNITVAIDGAQAIQILEEMKASESLPDLIVLDLNLPKKTGREVLAEIKSDAILKHIPVLVMTSSHDEEDILAAYSLNANCYIRKPMNLPDYERVIHAIEEFWFTTVTLPERHSESSVTPASPNSLSAAATAGLPVQ
jgi:two-component system, chemotaxis family, response regulator Rcp1